VFYRCGIDLVQCFIDVDIILCSLFDL
jgi:hypothetical protein